MVLVTKQLQCLNCSHQIPQFRKCSKLFYRIKLNFSTYLVFFQSETAQREPWTICVRGKSTCIDKYLCRRKQVPGVRPQTRVVQSLSGRPDWVLMFMLRPLFAGWWWLLWIPAVKAITFGPVTKFFLHISSVVALVAQSSVITALANPKLAHTLLATDSLSHHKAM